MTKHFQYQFLNSAFSNYIFANKKIQITIETIQCIALRFIYDDNYVQLMRLKVQKEKKYCFRHETLQKFVQYERQGTGINHIDMLLLNYGTSCAANICRTQESLSRIKKSNV